MNSLLLLLIDMLYMIPCVPKECLVNNITALLLEPKKLLRVVGLTHIREPYGFTANNIEKSFKGAIME